MPLNNRQRKIVQDGCTACQEWRDACALLRRLGFPDEAMEERCTAAEAMYKEANGIVAEFDATQKGGKQRGTE